MEAAPVGGGYVVSSSTLVAPDDWSDVRTTPPAGQHTYISRAFINPLQDVGTITPDWSVPFRSGVVDVGGGGVDQVARDAALAADAKAATNAQWITDHAPVVNDTRISLANLEDRFDALAVPAILEGTDPPDDANGGDGDLYIQKDNDSHTLELFCLLYTSPSPRDS